MLVLLCVSLYQVRYLSRHRTVLLHHLFYGLLGAETWEISTSPGTGQSFSIMFFTNSSERKHGKFMLGDSDPWRCPRRFLYSQSVNLLAAGQNRLLRSSPTLLLPRAGYSGSSCRRVFHHLAVRLLLAKYRVIPAGRLHVPDQNRLSSHCRRP